jgi:predicted RNA-binding Zn ribbon-like protein
VEIGNASAGDPTTKARIFELSGGHPALDLVNTLDWRFRESGPEEFLENYADVIRFTTQCGLVSAVDARKLLRNSLDNKSTRVLAAVRDLREASAEVFYAALDRKSPSASAVERLQACFTTARQQQELRWNGEKLSWTLPATASPDLPLWLLGLSTSALMTSDQMHLIRECGNAECRWLFVDTSKNHTRRWCNMKICGNRMKARRFKAQHRA